MTEHISVLLPEVIAMLAPQDGKTYFDGTFGGGGYSRAILENANCKVVAVDRDEHVKKIADEFSKKYPQRFYFAHSRYSDVRDVLEKFSLKKLDGIVLDLGLSNFQLNDDERGFSFNAAGALDMQMGLCDENAMEVIHKYSETDLANIIFELGEEPFSRRIAKNIKLHLNEIKTAADLAEVVRRSVRRRGKIDAATKTFQALRIFVNDELNELKNILKNSIDLLNPCGKIVIVSFHSLEDRIVKLFFRELVQKNSAFQLLTKKPIVPSNEETKINPKSRSAKLRGICMVG